MEEDVVVFVPTRWASTSLPQLNVIILTIMWCDSAVLGVVLQGGTSVVGSSRALLDCAGFIVCESRWDPMGHLFMVVGCE